MANRQMPQMPPGVAMPFQMQQGPTKEQLEETAIVRDLQIRTQAVQSAVASCGGQMVSAEEVVIRASIIRDFIADGDVPAEMPSYRTAEEAKDAWKASVKRGQVAFYASAQEVPD